MFISNLLIFFRLERERLSEKLRQKEVLERELNRERASLQEQLIKQAKLNEIIRQKDLFEKELRKEKNELQVCIKSFPLRSPTYCNLASLIYFHKCARRFLEKIERLAAG